MNNNNTHSTHHIHKPIKAVIFDLSGTIIDYGCQAPVKAFVEAFKTNGLVVTDQQVRQFMGMGKKEHLNELLKLESVQAQTQLAPVDSKNIYEDIQRKLIEITPEYSTLIPAAQFLIDILHLRDIPYAVTTGYPAAVVSKFLPNLIEQGFRPVTIVCSDQVRRSRPHPDMALKAAESFDPYILKSEILKIGDTSSDIEEGQRAGMQTFAVIHSSSEMGLTVEQIRNLKKNNPEELKEREKNIRERWTKLGVDYMGKDAGDVVELLMP